MGTWFMQTTALLCKKNLDTDNIWAWAVYFVPESESKQKARHKSVTSDVFISGNACFK